MMTGLFTAVVGTLILLHGYFYLQYHTAHPCNVAVIRTMGDPVKALGKPTELLELGRGDDLVACYRIALLGPDR